MKMKPSREHPRKQCLDMFARLSEFIDNELDAQTSAAIERHLADCRPCKVCLETLRRTVDFCRRTPEHPVPNRLSIRLKDLFADIRNGKVPTSPGQ